MFVDIILSLLLLRLFEVNLLHGIVVVSVQTNGLSVDNQYKLLLADIDADLAGFEPLIVNLIRSIQNK